MCSSGMTVGGLGLGIRVAFGDRFRILGYLVMHELGPLSLAKEYCDQTSGALIEPHTLNPCRTRICSNPLHVCSFQILSSFLANTILYSASIQGKGLEQ